ncbi:MAG: PAS domain-containing protein [Rhodospirillaceae bacterium]|nr:PAS domain-containing protein [Rhodospirillaceae bacterium]MBT4042980.1 PAS domain-containing protein [Rhodospirillaceae bacterium]MBT4688704.1 PAS domain-containing protein [Rhodospirillaceae bacterium]MBT5080952.1 PAS domain-containing protein [Rhodospirillaceae bacterium]MBT5523051.1 PAS domain-containing protein [Rhodospirillaceae bacterium]
MLAADDVLAVTGCFDEMQFLSLSMQWSPTLSDIDDDLLNTLLTYWSDLPRGPRLPCSSDVDPVNFKSALGHVLLLDVEEGGWDYRYRVFGSSIAARAGFDATGKLVSELPVQPMAPFYLAVYRACLERFEPLYTRHVPPPDIQVTSWDRLALPFEDGEGRINRFLVGMVPGDWRE